MLQKSILFLEIVHFFIIQILKWNKYVKVNSQKLKKKREHENINVNVGTICKFLICRYY